MPLLWAASYTIAHADLSEISEQDLELVTGKAGLTLDANLDFPNLEARYKDTEDSSDENLFLWKTNLDAVISGLTLDITNQAGTGMLALGLPNNILFNNTVLSINTELDPSLPDPPGIFDQVTANYTVQLTTANNAFDKVCTGNIILGVCWVQTGTFLGIPIFGITSFSNDYTVSIPYESSYSANGINSNLYEFTNPNGSHDLEYDFNADFPEDTSRVINLRVDKQADFRFILEAMQACSDDQIFGGLNPQCQSANPRIIIRDNGGNIVADGDINNLTGLAEDGTLTLGNKWVLSLAALKSPG